MRHTIENMVSILIGNRGNFLKKARTGYRKEVYGLPIIRESMSERHKKGVATLTCHDPQAIFKYSFILQ